MAVFRQLSGRLLRIVPVKIRRAPHNWSVTPSRAVIIQRKLAARIDETRPRKPLRLVAGADVAFSSGGARCVAAVVLWDLEERTVIEEQIDVRPVTYPYVPGLLSFREAPVVLAAMRKLRATPDGLMLDGHGLAHPRRFGLACHVGLICDLPAIGCAKSRLTGRHREPGRKRGATAALEAEGRIVGTVLRTQDGVRPVFVSVGHKIDLPTAEEVVLCCSTRYRLPEPTRLADRLVAAAKRRG
jgi:deoxyribonuclease V